jgi:hypothetical protein
MRFNEKRLIKERNTMLKRRSVEELVKFVNAHKQYYGEKVVEAVNNASYKELEITLNKMIVNVTSMPEELRCQCARWLITRGYDLSWRI